MAGTSHLLNSSSLAAPVTSVRSSLGTLTMKYHGYEKFDLTMKYHGYEKFDLFPYSL